MAGTRGRALASTSPPFLAEAFLAAYPAEWRSGKGMSYPGMQIIVLVIVLAASSSGCPFGLDCSCQHCKYRTMDELFCEAQEPTFGNMGRDPGLWGTEGDSRRHCLCTSLAGGTKTKPSRPFCPALAPGYRLTGLVSANALGRVAINGFGF